MGKREVRLARLFVEWRTLKAELEAVEAEIEGIVLEREESYAIPGVVRATYYSPSLKFDYEAGVKASDRPEELIEQAIKGHTKVREYVSWAKVIEELRVPEDEIPSEEKPARVRVKEE